MFPLHNHSFRTASRHANESIHQHLPTIQWPFQPAASSAQVRDATAAGSTSGFLRYSVSVPTVSLTCTLYQTPEFPQAEQKNTTIRCRFCHQGEIPGSRVDHETPSIPSSPMPEYHNQWSCRKAPGQAAKLDTFCNPKLVDCSFLFLREKNNPLVGDKNSRTLHCATLSYIKKKPLGFQTFVEARKIFKIK